MSLVNYMVLKLYLNINCFWKGSLRSVEIQQRNMWKFFFFLNYRRELRGWSTNLLVSMLRGVRSHIPAVTQLFLENLRCNCYYYFKIFRTMFQKCINVVSHWLHLEQTEAIWFLQGGIDGQGPLWLECCGQWPPLASSNGLRAWAWDSPIGCRVDPWRPHLSWHPAIGRPHFLLLHAPFLALALALALKPSYTKAEQPTTHCMRWDQSPSRSRRKQIDLLTSCKFYIIQLLK